MVCPCVADFHLGFDGDVEEKLRPILKNAGIFGVDLYEAGTADTVCGYFKEMITSAGAVADRAAEIREITSLIAR